MAIGQRGCVDAAGCGMADRINASRFATTRKGMGAITGTQPVWVSVLATRECVHAAVRTHRPAAPTQEPFLSLTHPVVASASEEWLNAADGCSRSSLDDIERHHFTSPYPRALLSFAPRMMITED